MFSNLNTGSIIYILDTKDSLKLSTGQITNITPPRTKRATFNPYDTNYELVMDITVTVNGERREFQQVPSNLSVANFGSDVFTIADSKEAMDNHIENIFQTSKSIVDGYDKHKQRMEECKAVRLELNPSLAAEIQRDSAISKLESKVDALTSQMQQLVTVFNGELKKQE